MSLSNKLHKFEVAVNFLFIRSCHASSMIEAMIDIPGLADKVHEETGYSLHGIANRLAKSIKEVGTLLDEEETRTKESAD